MSIEQIIKNIYDFKPMVKTEIMPEVDDIKTFMKDAGFQADDGQFEKTSIATFTKGCDKIQYQVAIVSEYDIKLAETNFIREMENQLHELIEETPRDIWNTVRNIVVYPVDWMIGLPGNSVKQTYGDKINKLIQELNQLFPSTNVGSDNYEEFIKCMNNYTMKNKHSFINNVLSRTVEYANDKLMEEYKTEFIKFRDSYYTDSQEVANIKKYTNSYCNDRFFIYYTDFLCAAQECLSTDEINKDKINKLFEEAVQIYTPKIKSGEFTCPRFNEKLVITDNPDGTQTVSIDPDHHFPYNNKYIGNRLVRSFQNLNCSTHELVIEYLKILKWSVNVLVETTEEKKYILGTNPIKKTGATITTKDSDLNDPNKIYYTEPKTPPTYKQLENTIKDVWNKKQNISGFSKEAQETGIFKAIVNIIKIANIVGYGIGYTLKMIAQILAPLVSLPVLVVWKLLKFLFKELFYKLVYDDLSTNITNGILPPLELMVSVVQLGYTILKLLFRPVKMSVHTILYSIHRILQELSVIFKTFLIKPLISGTNYITGDNFLMKVVVFTKGYSLNKSKIDKAVHTARCKLMIEKYYEELENYRREIQAKYIKDTNLSCLDVFIQINGNAALQDQINLINQQPCSLTQTEIDSIKEIEPPITLSDMKKKIQIESQPEPTVCQAYDDFLEMIPYTQFTANSLNTIS